MLDTNTLEAVERFFDARIAELRNNDRVPEETLRQMQLLRGEISFRRIQVENAVAA